MNFRPMSLRARENLTGYLFALPWFIGFVGLALGPMIVSFLMAFIRWDGISMDTVAWIGLDNYARAAGDPDVAKALWNTAYYSFISVPLGLSVGKEPPPLTQVKKRTAELVQVQPLIETACP